MTTIEVITTAEANNLSCSDLEQLQWSTEQKRVIYSYNVGDFCRLHKFYQEKKKEYSGIILGKLNLSIGQQLRGFLKIIELKTPETMYNQLIFLSNYIESD